MRAILCAAALALTLAPLQPAAADTGDITCHGGSLSLSYTPGLTYRRTPAWMAGTGDLGVCSSARHPAITGGSVRVEGGLTSQCPGPIGPGYARIAITWNDGTTTTVNNVLYRGDLTAYTLEGGTAHLTGRTTSNLIDLGAGCVLNGVTHTTATIDRLTTDHG
ncbi:hypothetical protein [Herbidospora sp. NBRC 101105]|uniref:hypothetical protein n=1 Tax=Herbidospora sp. NBRC 101105 TaxID=3032195 RepID=UPI0024A3F97A|nr:hypothetical protein [Herbidospora sp. NBRC 101105]GLX93778.1 hypothetical protein Hesp01_17280 [Herbidospora sp. NBRC 101105]